MNREEKLKKDAEYRRINHDRILELKRIYNSKQKNKEKNKKYYNDNKERIAEWQKKYCELHKEKKRTISKQYYNLHRDENLKKSIEWKKNNPTYNKEYHHLHKKERKIYLKINNDRIRMQSRIYQRKRLKNNPFLKINQSISRRIRYTITGERKNNRRWETLVGYTVNDLKKHLENQFTKNMSWDNYGKKWHIDHRIPVAWFSYSSFNDDEFKKCWSLNNLQPKYATENIVKKNKYAEPSLYQFGNNINTNIIQVKNMIIDKTITKEL